MKHFVQWGHPLVVVAWLVQTGACSSTAVDSGPSVASEPEGNDAIAEREILRDEGGFELRASGLWVRGDLHVHSTGASNDTGGDSHPGDIAKRAREFGLDFVVLTDHSNSTGSDPDSLEEDPALFNSGPEFPTWNIAQDLSEPGEFLMISGNELSPVAEGDPPSEGRGHVGCLPRTRANFDTESPFIDRPKGQVNGGSALTQARERGCFSILNHPYTLIPWISFDWTGDDYDAIEVWNGSGGGFDLYDFHSYNGWRCDLLEGEWIPGIGSSDNHRVHEPPPGTLLDPALGWPHTRVRVDSLTQEALVAGLESLEVTIQEGDSLVDLEAFDSNRERFRGEGLAYLRVSGKLDANAEASTLLVRRLLGCEDTHRVDAVPAIEEEILLEQAVDPGSSFSVTLETDSLPGVYTATLLAENPPPILGTHYGALSQPVVVTLE